MDHLAAKSYCNTEDILMKRIQKIFIVLTLLLLALTWATPALAKDLLEDRIVTGGTFTLETGDTLTGSLILLGGSATMQSGSIVTGDVLMFGGSVEINGLVEGSLVAFGGHADVMSAGVIEGDAVLIGAQLEREEGARVEGEIIRETEFPLRFRLPTFSLPQFFAERPNVEFGFTPLFDSFWFLFRTFLMAALAVLVVIFFPNPTSRAARVIVSQPLLSGGLGILTLIALPLLLVGLVITIILIPVSLGGFMVLGIALFFGWIAMGYELGERLSRAVSQDWAPAVSAAVGTFLLSLVAWGIDAIIPCVGWMVPLSILAIGLGSVILTRFGTQEYEGSGLSASQQVERVAVLPVPGTGDSRAIEHTPEVVEPPAEEQQGPAPDEGSTSGEPPAGEESK